MIDTPVHTTVPGQDVAAVRLTIPLLAMREEFPKAIGEIVQAVQQQGIQPTGPVFAHHFRRPTDTFDFAVCLPVQCGIVPSGRIDAVRMPALQVIRTTYHGDYSGLPKAWPEFIEAVQSQGASLRGDFIEAYVVGPQQGVPPSEWRTDLSVILTDAQGGA